MPGTQEKQARPGVLAPQGARANETVSPLVSDSQCSLFLCLSRRLLQRMSQRAGWAMWQWVVERWPTMHSNSASKMGAARNWVLRGHCQAGPSGFLSGSTLCSRTRGVLQAEGREGGLGHVVGATKTRAGGLEVAGGTNRTGSGDGQSSDTGVSGAVGSARKVLWAPTAF